jgi:hypothetical protein
MAMNLEEWLAIEQSMEEANHILLQAETSEPQLQLLLISSNAV